VQSVSHAFKVLIDPHMYAFVQVNQLMGWLSALVGAVGIGESSGDGPHPLATVTTRQ
jgi:hypothetical protein